MEGYFVLMNLVVYLSMPVIYVDAQDYCPQGFVEAGSDSSKCYLLMELPGGTDDGWTWNAARARCQLQPGVNPDLASIHSSLDQAILTSQFNLLTNSWPLWIGYSYSSSDWRWADGSESTYENWQEGEPSRTGCGAMYANTDDVGKWESLDCTSDPRGYICQTFKDADDPITTPAPTAPHQCESDWTPYQDSCLLLQATPQSWQDAEDDCVSQGGHLASVWGPEDNSAMFAIAADVNELPMWIGYYKESGQFKWSDNLPRIYENFVTGSPGSNDCTIMTSGDLGTWLDISCDLQLPYMCRTYPAGIPTTPALIEGSCPSADWQEWGQYCYYGSTSTEYFETAEVNCQSEGAHLVSIHSYLENELVDEMLREVSLRDSGWIGLYKEEQSVDDYKWTDGTPRDYEAWAMGEPNDPNTEHCVEMMLPANGGVFETLWNNIRCTTTKSYICKFDKGSPSPLISPWYLLTHNASFNAANGQNFTSECAQLYAQQINENAETMKANVNNRIGTDLCSGITTEQINIMYTSAPFITSGSMGTTSPSYIMTTASSLTLSAVHDCMSEIHDYLGSYTNWPGGEVLRPIDNCDSVNFEGSQFEVSDNRYVCLGRVNAKNIKEEGKFITEEAFLNFGVTHMGEFTTDVPMTSQCLSLYNLEFSGKTLAMASVVNGRIDDGLLCATVPGVKIKTVSPIFMTAQDDQGSTTQRYVLNSTDANTFDEITTCGSEISTYLQSHNNWDDPILGTIEGCPSVTFVPFFEETTIEWICRDNAANADMDGEKQPKK